MPKLIEETADAVAWVAHARTTLQPEMVFGRIANAVIWSDAVGPDGRQLVPVEPTALVEKINVHGLALLKGHDPGYPIGKVLRAAAFAHPSGERFVAAVLGFYDGKRLSFRDLGFDDALSVPSPTMLPALPSGGCINIATDPKEIEPAWVDSLAQGAPMPVRKVELSHNAAEPSQELIRVGLLFMTLVWNPFVTTIATEAGKATYAAMRGWVRFLFEKLGERKSAILELQSHHDGCQVSFIIRGKSVGHHYAAHDALPAAAVQAERLIATLKAAGLVPKLIVYEFDQQDNRWFPSFAELDDGRLVTDNAALIAVERLPPGVSLGLTLEENDPLLPSVREKHQIER
jgi:hypothetical protein